MPKETNCPCGEVVTIPLLTVEQQKLPCYEDWDGYDYHSTECNECGRRACGWNSREGTITDWITPADADASEREYERQLFSADMNEMYGRGNHCF